METIVTFPYLWKLKPSKTLFNSIINSFALTSRWRSCPRDSVAGCQAGRRRTCWGIPSWRSASHTACLAATPATHTSSPVKFMGCLDLFRDLNIHNNILQNTHTHHMHTLKTPINIKEKFIFVCLSVLLAFWCFQHITHNRINTIRTNQQRPINEWTRSCFAIFCSPAGC